MKSWVSVSIKDLEKAKMIFAESEIVVIVKPGLCEGCWEYHTTEKHPVNPSSWEYFFGRVV